MADAALSNAVLDMPENQSPNLMHGLNRLSPLRQAALMGSLAASISLGVVIALWSQAPDFTPLVGGLSLLNERDAITRLEAVGIDVSVDPVSGTLLVPVDRKRDAQVLLAEAGLFKEEGGKLELTSIKKAWGETESVFVARQAQALQIELARTIEALDGVDVARVHISQKKQTSFVSRDDRRNAAVQLTLRPGARFTRTNAAAVANLVVGAVARLPLAHVTVSDSRGNMLFDGAQETAFGSSYQFERTRALEEEKREKILDILARELGRDNVAVQVDAELDFTRVKSAERTVSDSGSATISLEVEEEKTTRGGATGIPGELSATPPDETTAPQQVEGGGEEGAGTAKPVDSRTRRIENKVPSTGTTMSEHSGPITQRLSIAILVNERGIADASGNIVGWEARTPEERNRYRVLAMHAAGFDEARGDQMTVENARFSRPPPIEVPPEPPLWMQPWVWSIAKQVGAGLLVLIIVFAVLRPLMRNLVGREVAERALIEAKNTTAHDPSDGDLDALEDGRADGAAGANGTAGDGADGLGGDGTRGAKSSAKSPLGLEDDSAREQQLDLIREIVERDPMRVANVFRGWVNQDVG